MNGRIVVTGGAGFVGSNLVDKLLSDNSDVTILDSLSRRGSEANLAWLRHRHRGRKSRIVRGDVRDFDIVQSVLRDADVVFHLAAQVAVTSSVHDPRLDFDVNALGTFNVLEAARINGRRPVVVFTSTNKVYGGMEEVDVIEGGESYAYQDLPYGVDESQPLDFHSPYGCSKGAADQYVHDYSRIYGISTVIFRMSCIYGPRQFGTEDQGWLAHFMIALVTGQPITIYGDGKQARDVLFVDDLIRAFRLAVEKIQTTRGQVYNIGGGPSNTLSVWTQYGEILERLAGRNIEVAYSDWRAGDQRCYVSDIRKAASEMGWRPKVTMEEGVQRLWEWVSGNQEMLRDVVDTGIQQQTVAR
jgi:CDP-paratose 2-epimerase